MAGERGRGEYRWRIPRSRRLKLPRGTIAILGSVEGGYETCIRGALFHALTVARDAQVPYQTLRLCQAQAGEACQAHNHSAHDTIWGSAEQLRTTSAHRAGDLTPNGRHSSARSGRRAALRSTPPSRGLVFLHYPTGTPQRRCRSGLSSGRSTRTAAGSRDRAPARTVEGSSG